MAGPEAASPRAHLVSSVTSPSAAYRVHAAHADAASPSPCAPACDTSTPVPLTPTHASVSPDAQASHDPSQILQRTHLGMCASSLLLVSEYWMASSALPQIWPCCCQWWTCMT